MLEHSLPLELELRIDEACNAFEAAWRAATSTDCRPRIEDYLAAADEEDRWPLLQELVKLELEYRRAPPPCAEDYGQRFPKYRQHLEAFFAQITYVGGGAAAPAAPSGASHDAEGTTANLLSPGAARAAPAGLCLPSIPGYEVQGVLGRGGMGVVYQARQVRPNRPVALKMILAGAHAGEEAFLRFRIEPEAVARLQHPHIVQVYEVGEYQGLPFFSMEFVAGGALHAHGGGMPRQAEEAARLAETLARAMAFAHQHGVIHRDLKPANILLTEGGDPKVTDFGLAKQLDADAGQTRTGQVMGTPNYMAPEQAAGRAREVGPHTDVYALGAVLYEALTGRPPFRAATVRDTLEQVCFQDPVPVRRLQPKVPRDLETICLKCLRKDPRQRYASMVELAEDLGRFLGRRPIQARPTGLGERGLKWVRRRPAVAALAAVSALAGLGLIASLAGLLVNAEKRAAAVQELSEAQARLDERQSQLTALGQDLEAAQRQLDAKREEVRRLEDTALQGQVQTREAHRQARLAACIRDVQLAQLSLREGEEIARGLQLLDRHRPSPGEEDVRGFEWYYLWRACHSERRVLPGHAAPVRAVEFSPDGKTLVSVDFDGNLKGWDPDTGKALPLPRTLGAHAFAAAYGPDGRTLAVGYEDGRVILWDPAAGHPRRTFRAHPRKIAALAFSPDGKTIATGSDDCTAGLWDAASCRQRAACRGHKAPVVALRFSPDGRTLLTSSADQAKLWDVATGEERITLRTAAGGGYLDALAFAPDGRTAAVGEHYPFQPLAVADLNLYDLASGQLRKRLAVPGGGAYSVAFAPDGRTLVAGSSGSGHLTVWNAAAGARQATYGLGTARVYALAFSPRGNALAAACYEGCVRLWDWPLRPMPLNIRAHANHVDAVALAPDGRSLATCGNDQAVKIWDAVTGQLRATLPGSASDDRALAFTPDGRTLVSAGTGHSLRVWDVARRAELAVLKGHDRAVRQACVSPDGKLLASAALDGTARLWDLATGAQRFVLQHESTEVFGVAFSPDGRVLASTGRQSVRLWDTATGKLVRVLQGGGLGPLRVAFSPDGRRVAAGNWGGFIALWDTETGREIGRLKGHTRGVIPVAFTPDGKTLVSGSVDGTVMLWDVGTLLERFTLTGHTDKVSDLAISQDGTRLVSAGWDGTVRIWEAPRDIGQEDRPFKGRD